MEKIKYNTGSVSTTSEIRSLGDKLTVEEGLRFISSDLRIAPNCVELVLTTLGYIYRAADHICCTERMLRLINYDSATHTAKLTANGLELLYRLVLNSIYRIKPCNSIITTHPIIFDGYTQTLAALDDKNLVQIDVALDYIYSNLKNKYNITNIDTDMYHHMLEDTEMFKFKANGDVAQCIAADIDHYIYYIYNAASIDKFNVVNDLSINSAEIYISKKAYAKLLNKLDEMFKSSIEVGLFRTIDERRCEIDGDTIREVRKSDKYISLSLFASMVIDNFDNECTESDVTKALVDAELIKIGDNDRIYINDSNDKANEYLYRDQYGRVLVRTENVLKLIFMVVSINRKLFDAVNDADIKNMGAYFGMDSNGHNYMVFPLGSMSPINPIQNMMAKPAPTSMAMSNTTESATTIKSSNENGKESNKK